MRRLRRCQGQAVRALADVLGSNRRTTIGAGRELIEAFCALADLRSLRAQAYVILAWDTRRAEVKTSNRWNHRLVRGAAAGGMLLAHDMADWQWFRVALICTACCARPVPRREHWRRDFSNRESIVRFLDRQTTVEEFFAVGTRMYPRGGKSAVRSTPVEAVTMAKPRLPRSNCMATRIFGRLRPRLWLFHGQNSLHQPFRYPRRRLLRRLQTSA